MQHDLIAAAVQMTSGEDQAVNRSTAERLIRRAAAAGAELVVLPEYFNCLGDRRAMLAQAEPLPGPTSTWLAAQAAELQITLVGGTFCEQIPGRDRAYNTSLTFDPAGNLIAVYRKRHLFDVELPDLVYRESEWLVPGNDLVHFRAGDVRVAPAVCYDLRFPEMFRHFAEQAVDVVTLPAAFTKTTGRAHWELLLRARAVENQCFVVAANQTGRHAALETYGHSLIVDPWGELSADAGETENVAIARLSAARLHDVRARLPALQHRRR